MPSPRVPDAVLVGNNLAVLVAAAELGSAGREVVLITDGRPAGGHFRGLRVADTDFDIGMVTLEQLGSGSAGPADGPDLAEYRADRRYDWTRFADLVDRWQERHVELRRVPTPEVLVEGRRWPDHLMTDRLDVVATLGSPPSTLVSRDDPAHVSNKTTGAAFDVLTYQEAAVLAHGPDVQRRLVTPFAEKVLGPALGPLLARYHRVAWLPLYWPETVADVCAGRPTAVTEHAFWTTSTGSVGELVRALERRVAALPTVTVDLATVDSLVPAAGGWQVRTSAGGVFVHPQPVLGLAHDRVAALLGIPAVPRPGGSPVTVLFALVRGSAIREPVACLLVADPEFLTYRVTDQDLAAGLDPEWRRVTVEAGPEANRLTAEGADVSVLLVAELCRLYGMDAGTMDADHPDVRVLRTMTAAGALSVPSAAVVAADRAAAEAILDACPTALLTGALLGTAVNSLGDQVVHGLAVAQRLG
jgi:hypothetical protein